LDHWTFTGSDWSYFIKNPMKTLIIGLGKSGLAAYELLETEGDHVVGFDDNAALLEKLSSQGKKVDLNPSVKDFDRIIISPGISPTHRYYCQALELGKEIIGEAEFALSRLHQPCVAITGTNGKTTVTLLIEHILKASGRKARALGNVGAPLTSYLKEADREEIMVVELSSFQLETMKTQVIDTGVILNITPDHLDRYGSMKEYVAAKCRLQEIIKPSGSFWVHQDIERDFKTLLKPNYRTYGTDPRCTLWTDRTALKSGEKIETILPIRYRIGGNHESENVLATWMICKTLGVDSEPFLAALETFKKPAHRIEFVACKGGVNYFDDSKGTNLDATIKAVETMPGKVTLIAGGVDKGASYQPWKKVFAGKVKRVVALGQAASKIAEELRPEFEVEIVATLKEAVFRAHESAAHGECVLLSPGCSSYDMFRDYAHRGDEFKKIVEEIK
jgi:UDP-N-acetylmuramoylalanine--D-glutamate ligase